MSKIIIKTKEEIEILKEGGKILREAILTAADFVKEGVSTKEVNDVAEKIIRKRGGEPAFLNFPMDEHENLKFPAATCVCVNDEVVHGLPERDQVLKSGDIVTIDLGVKYKNLFTDAAITVPVGEISEKAKKLIDVSKRALEVGLREIKAGARLGNYSSAVQDFVQKNGFEIVKILGGHGVGYGVHEAPFIPNYGERGKGMKFREGMVVALEPIVTENSDEVELLPDGMTFVTVDGGLAAEFEHTIVVTKKGYEILTK